MLFGLKENFQRKCNHICPEDSIHQNDQLHVHGLYTHANSIHN